VLGANDGIVSVSSLIVGVAAAEASRGNVLLAGVAGIVAGAMSMAAGEYVSVSSQLDTERADIQREKNELASEPESELDELTQIYVGRGLDSELARQVAIQLSERDALRSHIRDELGMSETLSARPIQAALASAAAFTAGAAAPLIPVVVAPKTWLIAIVAVLSLILLATLGGVSAYVGGSSIKLAAFRVTFWGAIAMLLTAGIGSLFNVAV
jgi:VIT1/CCC1 family predicted Fe2+/Mn2+ transporter